MRQGLCRALFLLLQCTAAEAQNLAYHFEGLAVSTYNDNSPYLYDENGLLDLSIGRGPDDQFTAGFRVDTVGSFKSAWSDSLVVSSNLALYTDTQYYAIAETGSPAHPPWRLDAGSLQFLVEKESAPFTVDYGLGGVVRGNLGGGAIQDAVHDGIDDVQFYLPYVGGYSFGPFLTGTLKYTVLDSDWVGWNWNVSGSGRGVWDVLGVLNDEFDALAQLDLSDGGTKLEFVTGGRLSLPGSGASQADMYSSGLFFDYSLELSLGDFRVQFGYAVNPYGAAPISDYPDYKDQNQEFHWTVIWGRDIPVPWALRFYP